MVGVVCVKCGLSLYVDNAEFVGSLDEEGDVVTECWHAIEDGSYLCPPVEGLDDLLGDGEQFLHHP